MRSKRVRHRKNKSSMHTFYVRFKRGTPLLTHKNFWLLEKNCPFINLEINGKYFFEFKFAPMLAQFVFFAFKTHCWLLRMHQNSVFHLWGSITATILLCMLSERGLRSKVVPLQMSNAKDFISVAGGTHHTEINPAPQWREIAKFWSHFLAEHSKRFLKRTYFFEIEEKMAKFWCFKVGST